MNDENDENAGNDESDENAGNDENGRERMSNGI
jgi:hypothetical protein